VLLQQVLLEAAAAPAVGRELETPFVTEYGGGRWRALEVDFDGREVTDVAPQPVVTPRPQRHVERHRIAAGRGVGEHAGVRVALGAAVFHQRVPIGGQGECEWLSGVE